MNVGRKSVPCQHTIFARYGDPAQSAGRLREMRIAVARLLWNHAGTLGCAHAWTGVGGVADAGDGVTEPERSTAAAMPARTAPRTLALAPMRGIVAEPKAL